MLEVGTGWIAAALKALGYEHQVFPEAVACPPLVRSFQDVPGARVIGPSRPGTKPPARHRAGRAITGPASMQACFRLYPPFVSRRMLGMGPESAHARAPAAPVIA